MFILDEAECPECEAPLLLASRDRIFPEHVLHSERLASSTKRKIVLREQNGDHICPRCDMSMRISKYGPDYELVMLVNNNAN